MLTSNLIIGEPQRFSLEERIFNTFCAISILSFFLEVFFNYFIGLKEVALICLTGTAVSALLYYLARIRRSTKLAIRCMGLLANLTFLFNYFYNSGIFGPNLLLFAVLLLVTMVIVPRGELWLWVVINIATVLCLMIFEYFNPDKVPNAYRDNLTKMVDFLVTYVVSASLICFAIYFIRDNYDVERSVVAQKNKEIAAQAEQILAQNRDLEKLNSEKAKLFSIVAHDIRSPLSSILGFLEVLSLCEITQEENERITKQLFTVTKDTSGMLSNVLAWSKTQMHGAKIDISSVNIAKELSGDLQLEKNIAQRKNVTLDLIDIEELHVAADLNMFLIVVRNLVSNAIKFTPSNGYVSVSTKSDNGWAEIIIKDNGIGIEPSQRKFLFQLKAQSTFGTNNEKGVGLGLLLCKEFVELQGGKISYLPNPEGGSIFVVAFKLYHESWMHSEYELSSFA